MSGALRSLLFFLVAILSFVGAAHGAAINAKLASPPERISSGTYVHDCTTNIRAMAAGRAANAKHISESVPGNPTDVFTTRRQFSKAFALSSGSFNATRGTATIGRLKDLAKLGPGEKTLLKHLEGDLGSPAANWARNSGVLRQEMAKGLPIRDASVDAAGKLVDHSGTFLNAERNLLRDRGWSFDPSTTLWSPP